MRVRRPVPMEPNTHLPTKVLYKTYEYILGPNVDHNGAADPCDPLVRQPSKVACMYLTINAATHRINVCLRHPGVSPALRPAPRHLESVILSAT